MHTGRRASGRGEASLPAAGPLGTHSAAINTHLPGLTDHEAPFCSGFVCLPLMHVFRSDTVLVWLLPTWTAVFQGPGARATRWVPCAWLLCLAAHGVTSALPGYGTSRGQPSLRAVRCGEGWLAGLRGRLAVVQVHVPRGWFPEG